MEKDHMSVGERSEQNRDARLMGSVQTATPFVNRKQPLDVLSRCLEEARGGRPQVVLLQGEAGIGKTRLLKEVRSLASHCGIEVCFGRCYENLTLPYLPFVESLFSRLEPVLEEVKPSLRADAEIIERLLHPEEKLSLAAGVSLSAPSDQDKLRLLLAVSRATVRLAQRRPLLLCVDDLHWADQPSLDLFSHLVFAIADTAVREPVPVLIIGAYRPVEPHERLARTIVRFQREDICQTLELSGFGEAEVNELIQSLGLARPSHQLVATVSRATQGNPLFIQEVLHQLVEQDALQKRGGYLVTTLADSDLRLPEQVTVAIAARTRGLSDECRSVLTLASLLGDNFSLQTLSGVSGVSEEKLLDLLEEGIGQRLLLNEEQTFQFAHPLIRHVFYHEPSAARRQRLHLQIARTLEYLYAGSLEAHLLEIVHHLVNAGPAAQAEKLVQYAFRAGDQVFAMFAWDEAARCYEAALSAAETTTALSVHDRATLHYRAGLAHYRDMDVGPALDHYEKAIAAYRLTNDLQGLAQVLEIRTRAYLTQASVPYGTLADVQSLEEVLNALGEEEPRLRGRLLAILGEAHWHARQTDKAEEMARRALAIGHESKDAAVCSYASHVLALAYMQSMSPRQALESWHNALDFARQAGDLWLQAGPLTRIPWVLTGLGRLEEAEAVAVEAGTLTRKIHNWAEYSMATATLTIVAVIKGDFAMAERHAREVMLMMHRSHYPWGGARSLPALACARAAYGAWDEARDAIDMLIEPGRVFAEAGPAFQSIVRVYRQLVLTYAGAAEEVRQQVGTNPPWAVRRSRPDMGALSRLGALVEIADCIPAPTLAEQPYHALVQAVGQGAVFSTEWVFLLQRILGVAATLSGCWEKAEAHFQAAIATATAIGAQPELGRSYLDYARMLATRGNAEDRRRIVELISQACALFQKLGMVPFVRRAVQFAEALRPPVTFVPQQDAVAPDDLKGLEEEILDHVARGRTNQEIAEMLVLSLETVTHSVSDIFAKTGASERKTAAAYVAERGFVSRAQARRIETASVGREAQDETANIFCREGDYWVLAYQGTVCRLKDSKGLHHIALLLRAPGREFHAIEVATAMRQSLASSSVPAASALSEGEIAAHSLRVGRLGDAGEPLDTQAKAAYKRRVDELREELEEVQRFNDPGRAAKIRAELEFLTDELAAAVGVGGRNRQAKSAAERARLSITKTIKAALRHIEENHPVLGQHLATSIKTGTFFSYMPDPSRPISWIFS
ncbi:MAG TPA: AAA family ATPase [Candidatus Binatia bacterium]|nr:AAA family ATPase [Candidatus Binatia bacterium]